MLNRKIILPAIAIGALAVASPASAGGWWGGGSHSHHPGCGHGGSTSGGWGSSGGVPDGGSSGGVPDGGSSGGTEVPEPGMLAMFGAGLIGVGFARSRRRRRKA
ncbi:hypothetical protein FHS61_002030 [Altererythrobacter atlanticus]|uniref:PEP-CTERM motif protein n=1 Tax=Croceibacterium atlanticum TaxID=1267766 RepID=A0A0F7KQT5_9SPHN|nr:PEP-CTERM sorting domain-containing protein [Croceibacterium atlanticum]AKH41542.1 PEP-CTERM motif protein [Croceibacterium atlanticum]MBB5733004.1 hypothetical protein [Croceibacterium atlanticum]